MESSFERRKLGRRFYPESIVLLILEQVRAGRNVTEICENPAFPCAATFYNWIASDTTLAEQYAAAMASRK